MFAPWLPQLSARSVVWLLNFENPLCHISRYLPSGPLGGHIKNMCEKASNCKEKIIFFGDVQSQLWQPINVDGHISQMAVPSTSFPCLDQRTVAVIATWLCSNSRTAKHLELFGCATGWECCTVAGPTQIFWICTTGLKLWPAPSLSHKSSLKYYHIKW